ncbi:MAG: selenoneine biosynthesis selenosugar synthase SenB [Actinomycetota bacterium]
MRICIVTPEPPQSRRGNRVTALRWSRILRDLGHGVVIAQEYRRQRCDLLVALHARRSAPSVDRFRQRWPTAPLVLALTGTDLYGDIHDSRPAQRALEQATLLVVLQPLGIAQVPEPLRCKTRVIYQSALPPSNPRRLQRRVFEAAVLAHMRPVKDPFRAALAARLLPADSNIRILHLGAASNDESAAWALAETASNPHYRWLGELPRWKALRVLAGCRLLVLTSRMEGGANVVSEALACSVPVLSSSIPGSHGLLGPDYPGYFPVEDAGALARLLERAERDASFHQTLREWCARLKPLVDPARERRSWAGLLRELVADP